MGKYAGELRPCQLRDAVWMDLQQEGFSLERSGDALDRVDPEGRSPTSPCPAPSAIWRIDGRMTGEDPRVRMLRLYRRLSG